MTWYRGGNVTVTTGSDMVVGYGTIWSSQVTPGDIFFLASARSTLYEVAEVIDNNNMRLIEAYEGTNLAGAEYAVIQNFTNTPNALLASKFSELLAQTKAREHEMQEWLAGTVDGGPNNNGYYPVTTLTGTVNYIPCPALIRPPESQALQTSDALFNLVKYPTAGWYQSLDLSIGAVFEVTLTEEDTEIVFRNANSNPRLAQHFTMVLVQGTGSNKCSDWPANIRWNQSRPPILSYTIGKRDVIDFFSIDAGVTWMGFYGGTQIPA